MPVERKYERDIDILLAEEFSVSPAFLKWFLGQTRFAEHNDASIHDVFVSQSDTSGESDLVAIFEIANGTRLALHIENKIDAPFMPQQRERYDKRAATGVERGDYNEYEVILCAPKQYRETSTTAGSFATYISYEEIAAAIRNCDDSPRGKYRATFIETAAKRNANNWKRQDDEATNAFWNAAYEIGAREFPILEMKPLSLTKGSSWITFRPRDFPTHPVPVHIALKGFHGNVDLTFSRTTAYMMAEKMASIIQADMTIHQTSSSSALRIKIDPIDVEGSIEDGMPNIRKAFEAAERLIRFYRKHRVQIDTAAQESMSAGDSTRKR